MSIGGYLLDNIDGYYYINSCLWFWNLCEEKGKKDI